MSERTAIYTIAIGDGIQPVCDITLPRMERYARDCGVEFHVLREYEDGATPHFAKFKLLEIASRKFDRVLYLDADILVTEQAENIFEQFTCALHDEFQTPYGKPNRVVGLAMTELRRNFDADFQPPYFNTGVMLLDKKTLTGLADRLSSIEWMRLVLWEQCQLNYELRRLGQPIEMLPPKWNFQYGWTNNDVSLGVPPDTCFVHFCGLPGIKVEHIANYLQDSKL